MTIEATNKLLAIPWPDLAAQFSDDINTAVNCMLSDEWKIDTGKKGVKMGGVKVGDYRVQMDLDAAEFTSSIASPPGYRKISLSGISAAAPLNGTWSAAITSGFTSRFRVWVSGEKVLDASPRITQSLEVDNFKILGNLSLDPSEPDRPRLKEADVSVKLRGRLKGLLNFSTGNLTVGVEYEPPDSYRLKIPLNIPITDAGVPGITIGAGFEGFLVIAVSPRIGIGYEGDLALILFKTKVAGKKIDIEADIPFKFYVDTGLPCPKFLHDLLPAPKGVPIDWGENPPPVLQKACAPDADFDFLSPALEIEEAVLPQAVAEGSDIGVPIHAPYGLIYEIRTFCDGSAPPRYETIHDVAIWTGHFLAAESFRFAATQAPEALKRIKYILGGIEKLFQVTAVRGLFARSAIKATSPFKTEPWLCSSSENAGTTCKPGSAEQYYHLTIDGEPWCGFGRGIYPTSRDSYVGIMMGMGYAYLLVPDTETRGTISRLVTDALCFLHQHNWNVRTPGTISSSDYQKIKTSFFNAFDLQLALMRLGVTVNPQTFTELYHYYSQAAESLWIPIWGGILDPISQYYKLNLAHGTMSLILSQEENTVLHGHFKKAFNMLRRSVRHHRNAYFNLVRIMTELPPDRQSAIDEPSGFSPCMTLGEEIRLLLKEWLIRRRCIPGPRGLPVERAPDPGYLLGLLSPSSHNKTKSYTPLGSSEANADLVASYALPVHKRPGAGVDYVWQRSPFDTQICMCGKVPRVNAGDPELEGPGIDYLLPFWMAAYLNIIQI